MPDRLLGNQPRLSSAQAQRLANAQRTCSPPIPRRPATAAATAAATTIATTPSMLLAAAATQRLARSGWQEILGVSSCRHPPQPAVPPTARKAANPVKEVN